MAVAAYQQPSSCNTCDTTVKPVFNSMAETVTKCPTTCGDNIVNPAISVPMMPDGVLWETDYFWQVMLEGDSAAVIDYFLNPVFQRIAWVKRFPIFVTVPLTDATDPVSGMASRQGSGTTVGLAPEIGDLFIAPLENNTLYVFRVTEAIPLKASNPSVLTIDYQAVRTLADMPNLMDDLAHKIHEGDVYAFNLQKFLAGQNPFDTAETQANDAAVQTIHTQLIKDWETFYDTDSACYVTKLDTFRIYDPYVNDVMTRLLPYNRNGYRRASLHSLWTREVSTYHTADVATPYNTQIGFSTIKVYDRTLVNAKFNLSHIRHTSIEYIALAGQGLPADVGAPMSTVTGTTVHATGYLTSPLYGTTDPAATALDQLIYATHTKTVTVALIVAAYAAYPTMSMVDKYWVIPAILQAIRSRT